ncbi:MAG: S8 family serine peptidase [Candidatus Krumholzibacteriota bacterium]|nr:S8 family serine peptidase [Candidatus Krumholzibacteriota bacterium]
MTRRAVRSTPRFARHPAFRFLRRSAGLSARHPAGAVLLAAGLALLLGISPAAAADGAVRLRAAALRPGSLPRAAAPPADGLWIVHFDRGPGRAEREALAVAGAEILGYLPDDAYLVRLAPGGEAALDGVAGADWRAPYLPEWKLAPEPARAPAGGAAMSLELILAPDAPLAELIEAVRALGAEPRRAGGPPARPRLWLRAASALLPELSRLPHLVWMEPTLPITERNDDIKWICQSGVPVETPVWDQGIHGEGEILGHIDSRFDWGNCWFADPEGDPIGPDHRKIAFTGEAPPPAGANATHGTHTAGILVGDGYQASAGADTTLRALAYRARLASSNYQLEYDLYADLAAHHGAGARVHSNSWGQDGETSYTALCQAIDAYSHDVEDDLVVFACTNMLTLRTPENAKNVLAVGASLAGPYFNQQFSGGEGPTADGRRKPEIYAPGYLINSAYADQPCNQLSKSGTSMACPAVASAGALARQYFREGWYPTGAPEPANALIPSGALLRAVLLNATFPMDSLPYGYPNDLEGWGRLVLDESLHFAGEARDLWIRDVRNAQGLETGEWVSYVLPVAAGDEALKITLVFTDPPGEVAAADPVVNDLDLRVLAPGGEAYRGNVFDVAAGVSETGGAADALNTVERVIIADPVPGAWEVRVEAAAVPLGPQGYALAAAGNLAADQTPPAPVLAWEHTGASLDSLRFTVTADEPLAAAPFTLAAGGLALAVRPGDEDGLLWEADYGLPERDDSLAVTLSVRDLVGNEAALATALAVRRTAAGAAARLDGPDGRFTLEIGAGALDRDATLVAEALPEAGRRVREGEILSAYRVRPCLDLDPAWPSLVSFRYDPDSLPAGATADRLLVLAGEAGDTLASYHAGGSPPVVSGNPFCLADFRLVVGPAGSNESADAAFLALGRGYPNPFRGEAGTTVSFSLRAAQRVDLAVYDVAGRLVARLVDGVRLLPGTHHRTWDGCDDAGEEAASGVYFARLETASGVAETVRLVLLR